MRLCLIFIIGIFILGHNNNNYNKNKQTKKFFILKRYDGDVTLGWPYNASEAALKFINKVTCYHTTTKHKVQTIYTVKSLI